MIHASITIVGKHGRHLSRFLKDHLKENGIEAHAVGLNFKNRDTKRKIQNAKTLIFVHPDIKKAVCENVDVKGKHMICLDVTDVPDAASLNSKRITGEEWVKYQNDVAYPTLIKQIKKHLTKMA